MTESRADGILLEACEGLRRRDPLLSAATVLVPWQRYAIYATLAATAACGVAAPLATARVAIAAITAVYFTLTVARLRVFQHGLFTESTIVVSDDEAQATPDEDLPHYTVLVPAYREPEVIGDLIGNLGGLEYPRSKLELMLLLEEDDEETRAAAAACDAAGLLEIVLVPASHPRTKPKACNYGLALSRGSIVTIYDAEDIPDPLQLRRVVVGFDRLGPEYACVQCKLGYHNGYQNLLTRWFASEYGMWFSLMLPGLAALKAPLPLGGTSNHIRAAALRSVGAWDPYNVTEDADLGIRLRRGGHQSAVLDSVTFEEANSDAVNWVKQRSRWLKGYLQTWLVHMRTPRRLLRELGPSGFFWFNVTMGGTPLLTLLNPVFWGLALWWLAGHSPDERALFNSWAYYGALINVVIGSFATIYMHVVAARILRTPRLLFACLVVPLYWALMSAAAIKAVAQLITAPSFWEKTQHGLDGEP